MSPFPANINPANISKVNRLQHNFFFVFLFFVLFSLLIMKFTFFLITSLVPSRSLHWDSSTVCAIHFCSRRRSSPSAPSASSIANTAWRWRGVRWLWRHCAWGNSRFAYPNIVCRVPQRVQSSRRLAILISCPQNGCTLWLHPSPILQYSVSQIYGLWCSNSLTI